MIANKSGIRRERSLIWGII